MRVFKKGCLTRAALGVALALVFFAAVLYFLVFLPFTGEPFESKRHGLPPITPPWALECWLWEDDYNTADYTLELLNGYLDHDFPVRTVLLDSPWSLRYNDFVVDEKRFPDPAKFFRDLKDRDIRVVMWMTCMVNSSSSDTAIKDSKDWFDDFVKNGWLLGGDYQFRWWKGTGGFIDYTNPAAMAKWRGMQQQVLDWGIDGWKLDGTATNCSSKIGPVPVPFAKAHSGWITTREYMDHYYGDEYRHGLEKNPEFVTLARAMDSVLPWTHPEGFAPIDASPVNWVGDNRHTWADKKHGLQRAIRCILDSATAGYDVVGSDVAGYHGGNPIPPEIYIRWTEFSTFCGLFLNGGHEERRMWKRTPEELEIVRTYSWLHTELVPYMYSHVVAAHEGGPVLMRPLKPKFEYLFGDALLVAPIYENSPRREVTLPEGRWRWWFDDTEVIEGPKTFTKEFRNDQYPVYVRDGAIIPMHVARPYTGIGDKDWDAYLTLNIYPHGKSAFKVRHTDNSGALDVTVEDGRPLKISLDGVLKPHILRVFCDQKPAQVERDGQPLAEGTDWTFQPDKHRLIVRQSEAKGKVYTVSW
jgi:alpha-D-xyloside xylohydrolase